MINDKSKHALELSSAIQKTPHFKICYFFGLVAAVLGLLSCDSSTACSADGLRAGIEIFKGITYGCESLEPSDEGGGSIHWVRIDLTAPSISLYVSPLDPAAVRQGWQYRLRPVGDVLNKEDLAVAINASLFTTNSGWPLPISGDFAKGVETTVADHVVSHIWEHTYLLWFDDQLMPHLRLSKPPTAIELAKARWGVGGQGIGLWDGKARPGNSRTPDSRTAMAVDKSRNLLFLAVGNNVSPRRMFEILANLGAKDGMLLDGGLSSSMVIGEGAVGVEPGIVAGKSTTVATHFGVRAARLDVVR